MKRSSLVLILLLMLFITPMALAQQSDDDEKEEEPEIICEGFEGAEASVRVSYYMGEGAAYMRSGEYGAAIHSYSCIVIKIDNDYIDAFTNRAVAHTIRREYDLAIEDYTAALAINSSFIPAYNNRGIVHTMREEYDQAIADFSRIIDIDSSYVLAYLNRGIVYAAQGDYDTAIEDFERVIDLGDLEPVVDVFESAENINEIDRDELPEYNRNYARAYAMLGLIHSQRALEDYQRYIWLTNGGDHRISSAAGALESRFTFELRFDDGTWLLTADIAR